jgi:two-component system cell cycle sensor histidine kinase/response regulator CckA
VQLPRSKRAVLLIAGFLLASAAYVGVTHPWRHADDRVYRIGWQQVPPFQQKGTDISPTGLAVEFVRDAARRRGIRLEWVFYPGSAEAALRNHELDLWVMMTILPERKGIVHISQPYLQHDTMLLVRSDSTFSGIHDLESAAISHLNLPINGRLLRSILPQARLVPTMTETGAIEDVCTKRTDAVFIDELTGIAALLAGPSCASQPLRVIPLPALRITLGVGATLENREVADEIRSGMDAVSEEGESVRTLTSWGYFSPHSMEYIGALRSARRREQWLVGTTVIFAAFLALTAFSANRIRRQRNRIELAEGALRRSEQKLRLMADNLKEMVLAYGMDRCLVFANPAVERLTGYSMDELEKEKFICWIHPDDRSRMLGYWDQLFQGGAYREEQYRLITKDGRMKWMAATWGPMRDETGRQIGVQGIERDVTERKLADEALRESERRFRGLLEHVQLAAALLDINGNYVFVNDYALAVTGWTRSELMGHHINEFMPPDRHSRIHKLLDRLARTGEPEHWFAEIPLLTKDGKRRCLQVNNVALHDSNGKVVAIASLGADVTDHRALQERYLQSQKLESLGTLAGGVAHDFNNLLTVINGYSDMVFRSLREGDPVRPKIDEIRKAGERAAELTQQLLAFSRRQIAQPRPVDLNRMVEESGAMFRSLLGEDIELAMRLGRPLGQVMADPGQMHQVLMNLLANARDAMPDGGRVTIETRNVAVASGDLTEHSEATPGSCVLLLVSDTGVGIDEEVRVHLFEPFFTTKGLGKGTGLGLSTVYGIVKQSRGWISVCSDVGKGATFKIYLPRIDREHAAAEEQPQAVTARGNHETVLVVEDQKDVRGLAMAILESLGYRALSAADGPAALALAAVHEGPIDLLLTDVVLPGMNGQQVAERLKLLRPGIAVLFTSGYSQDVIAHRGVLDREVAYIPKPYSPRDLATKVREVLGD